MNWTEPTKPEEIRYFNKHAAERRLFGWFLVVILAIWAVADFYGFQLFFTDGLPPALAWAKLPITLAILIALHLSLYTTATTFFFDKLDDDERTDSTIWIPAAITLLMLFASREGSRLLLQSVAPVARETTTVAADAAKGQKLEAEKKTLDSDLDAIAALYADRIKSAEKPHKDAIARHRRSLANTRWDDKARRSSLLAQIRKAEEARDAATAALLAEKSQKQANTMKRYEEAVAIVNGSHTAAVQSIESANRLEREAEQEGRTAANRYSWLISVMLAVLFWGVAFRWVTINVKSGIVPQYSFTEFEKSGGPAAWLRMAISDAWKRQMFRLSVWLHNALSRGARELPKMDGRVSFTDPEDFDHQPSLPDGSDDDSRKVKRLYPRQETPAQMAMGSALQNETPVTITNENLVITREYTDAKAELSYRLQRIQQYHAKWKSNVGTTETIIENLLNDWAIATKIMTSTPADVLGDKVKRYHEIADLEFEMLKSPRAKDVKKEQAA